MNKLCRPAIQPHVTNVQHFERSRSHEMTPPPNVHNVNKKLKVSSNFKIITRSNKLVEALFLPSIINCNPQSLYNKVEEFKTLVNQMEIDLSFLSEKWEREELSVSTVLGEMEGFTVVSNVHQCRSKGGWPAIIVNNKNYSV